MRDVAYSPRKGGRYIRDPETGERKRVNEIPTATAERPKAKPEGNRKTGKKDD